MKRKIGIVCMCCGLLLLCGAAGLYAYNIYESAKAQKAAETFLPKLLETVETETESTSTSGAEDIIDPEYYDPEMTVKTIDGYDFIGYITLPKLGLQLPVMAQTDASLLQISPCRFTGSAKTDDLVIGAHNYQQHFGRISELAVGDEVLFTDMDGVTRAYEVATQEVLAPDEAEHLTAGNFALSLYTCTYGGQNRITVRCDRVK